MAAANSSENRPVRIALNLIKADHALQPRVEMDAEHWNRMAAAYVEGEDVPPPVHLFYDGKFYWLVDGFHRYKAMWSLRHMGAKFTHIKAFVHNGTKQEAIVFAAQANLDNRSKPMDDLDRKKALWMVMDLPDWRKKSPLSLGKMFGIRSSTTAKKYWAEYFAIKGLPVPAVSMNEDGVFRPTFRNSKKIPKKPTITASVRGSHRASVNGESVYLGLDPETAKKALDETLNSLESKRAQYELNVVAKLASRCIHSDSVYETGEHIYGLFARSLDGTTVITWESFRNRAGITAAIGRICHAREKIGATRSVVLCPVEDGPRGIMDDCRRMGIEFMTMEDFVASLKGEGDSSP